MLTSRIAALAIATGALLAAAGPAFADSTGDAAMPANDWNSAVVIDPNPVDAGHKIMVSDGYDHRLICKAGTKHATAWSDGFKDGKIELTTWGGSWGGQNDGGSWAGQKDGKGHDALVGYGRAVRRPGWYDVKLSCDGDRRPSGFGKLHVVPWGADTGDGASVVAGGASDVQKTSGVSLIGSAAGIGAFALRRKFRLNG